MYRKTLTLLLFICLIGSFNAQTNDCVGKIKTGKFEYYAGDVTITVVRTKKKQIETFNSSKVINKIKWISETEYITTFVKEINLPGCLEKGDKMKMTIVECNGTEYKVQATSAKCGNVEVVVKILD
ncbi:MAG: hypothetical protein ACI9J3_003841 [Parvicellaceae bacterium]|jgi:hypothetical protein